MAAANHYGIPAGVSALVWLLAWGLFLLGLAHRQPDWSLLPLSLAAAILTAYYPAVEGGWYFLSEGVLSAFSWPGLRWGILLALAAFLAMRRSKAFWLSLGKVTAWSAGLLLCAYFLSRVRGGYLAFYLELELPVL